MSTPDTPCPGCQGASAEVAVRSLSTHPGKDMLIDEGFLMVGTARCPACGQLYLETRNFFDLTFDDKPSARAWHPISDEELDSLQLQDDDARLSYMDQLTQDRPALKCDDLGARWERDRSDRLMYCFTSVWGMNSVNKVFSMTEELYVALDTKRLKADGWMHDIYPGTPRGDAIGIVGRDEIADYAATEVARQAFISTPPRDPFYLIHTLDNEAEPEPEPKVTMGPPPHGVMKAIYGLKTDRTLWGIARDKDGYLATGMIYISLNIAQLEKDRILHQYTPQSFYLDLIGVVTFREALVYASNEEHRQALIALHPRPDFIAIRAMEI